MPQPSKSNNGSAALRALGQPQQNLGGKQQSHHEPEERDFVMFFKPAFEAAGKDIQPRTPYLPFACEPVICLLHEYVPSIGDMTCKGGKCYIADGLPAGSRELDW